MEERKQEISVHKNLLRAEIRTTEEERHENAKELSARLTRIDKLKKKYQLLLLQISPDEDEEKSQAYYIIKAAQVYCICMSPSITYSLISTKKSYNMTKNY